MKFLVLGNSGTDRSFLEPGDVPWPDLVRAGLESRLGGPVECANRAFVPMGDRAIPYARKLVDEVDPEIVIVPLSVYVCAIGWPSLRIRQRFGERAYLRYRAVEGRLTRGRAPLGSAGSPPRSLGRRLLRRLIGTATHTTVEEATATYAALLRELARDEARQVLVVGESHFSAHIQRENPRLLGVIREVQAAIRPLVEAHHFLWADVHEAYEAGPGSEDCQSPDGNHANGVGHHIYAEMVLAAVEPILPGRAA